MYGSDLFPVEDFAEGAGLAFENPANGSLKGLVIHFPAFADNGLGVLPRTQLQILTIPETFP